MSELRVLSFGAGVQSTAVLFLALEGRIPAFDLVLFADTGNEPPDVYEHVAACYALLETRGVAAEVVRGGDVLSTGAPLGTGSALDVPWFLRSPDGSDGMGRRECTTKLKIDPMRRAIRGELKTRGLKRATQTLGISVDEYRRIKTSDVRYITNDYPLVELEWTRGRCAEYLAELAVEAGRSACVVCPYHSRREWRRIRDEQPEEWARAVRFERELQLADHKLHGTPFLHRQRVPLDEVDLSTPADHGQLSLDDECEGVCFT